VEAKIVDSKGKECPCGEVGEIILRSDTVMKGYWRLPEETRLVLKDGWVYTGDIGRMDEKGYIYLIDRKSDLIISGGFNVYPKEVESVLDAHPKVRESAVLGVPDRKWGEAIKALVVLKEGCAATEEELINFCRDRLADFKKPKSVEFVDRLPRSSFDKVDRKILREKYWKGLDRRIS
jgi:acyl-CoA synthetase (AMP-forming)/AMP-acid ligase II